MVLVDGDFMDKQLGINREEMIKKAKEKYKKEKQKNVEFDPEDDSFLYETSFSASQKANQRNEEYNEEYNEENWEEEFDENHDFEEGFDDEELEWENDMDDELNDDFNEKDEEIEFATPPKLKSNKDYRIFPGGPYQSEINSWKKQFGEIYTTEICGERFIWRCINRYEYKEIVSIANTDPLMREEMICETCVLYPSNYDFETMANGKGGIPAALSELIMEKSGFTRNFEVRKL
ncbi:MAG: hypothetical protein N2043_02195 [Ignavibacterium sp.]|nr:hypothetical protein [Ignavibacterium sp.]